MLLGAVNSLTVDILKLFKFLVQINLQISRYPRVQICQKIRGKTAELMEKQDT